MLRGRNRINFLPQHPQRATLFWILKQIQSLNSTVKPTKQHHPSTVISTTQIPSIPYIKFRFKLITIFQ